MGFLAYRRCLVGLVMAAGLSRPVSAGDDPKGVACGSTPGEVSLHVVVEQSPTQAANTKTSRCIEFELYFDCAHAPITFEESVLFEGTFQIIGEVHRTISIPVPSNPICMTARDPLHTLRSCYTFEPDDCDEDGVLHADFVGDPFFGGNWLVNGNLDGNLHSPFAGHDVIDILDFAHLVPQFLAELGDGSSPCGTKRPHADVNGDGWVDQLDYSFISINFFETSEECCCPNVSTLGNTTRRFRVTNQWLRRGGMCELTVADLNNDQVVDLSDMAALLQGVRPGTPPAPCPLEINDDVYRP